MYLSIFCFKKKKTECFFVNLVFDIKEKYAHVADKVKDLEKELSDKMDDLKKEAESMESKMKNA